MNESNILTVRHPFNADCIRAVPFKIKGEHSKSIFFVGPGMYLCLQLNYKVDTDHVKATMTMKNTNIAKSIIASSDASYIKRFLNLLL